MRFDVVQRCRPFSHLKGVHALLPGSDWAVQAYPTLLCFTNLHSQETIHVEWGLTGPVTGFTLELDLEKGLLWLFGQSREGFFRFRIRRECRGIQIFVQRAAGQGIAYRLRDVAGVAVAKGEILIPLAQEPWWRPPCEAPCEERLSLGMHKAQDWDLLLRRGDLREIAPLWIRMGQQVQPPACLPVGGTMQLLHDCSQQIRERQREHVEASLRSLFFASFRGLFVPRLIDGEHQGIVRNGEAVGSPLALLTEGARILRSLFIQEREGGLVLLPCLPSGFVSGRYLGLCASHGERLDIEWSKRFLRCAIVRGGSRSPLLLELQTPIQKFRLRRSLRERGVWVARGAPIAVQPGERVFLDRFTK